MNQTIELKKVSKKIGNKEIIHDLNLSIHEGEVLGLLGPNGAGKTTIIRMIVGLVGKTTGNIIVCGYDTQTNRSEALANVGAIVENPEMYPFLSGYKNLAYFSRMHPDVSTERINELVRFVDLQDRIHDKVDSYSLGMKQRLGIAQALLNNPRVLILDEPTNGLDPAGMKELRRHIRMLAKEENVTVIVSSHLLSEIELMCDRIAIINEGKLVAIEYVKEKQNNRYSFNLSDSIKAQKLLLAHYQVSSQVVGEILKLELPNTNIRISDFVKLFVENAIDVNTVIPVKNTLEDRFMNLTAKKGVARHDEFN